jgi:integrase
MPLRRQAQTLDPVQQANLVAYVAKTPYAPARNVVIVRLSFEGWLRAKEIACVRWRMVMDASGQLVDVLRLEDAASKGHSGRVVRLPPTAVTALWALYDDAPPATPDAFVVRFRKASLDPVIRSQAVQALFHGWYAALRFHGASSHSGRRTGITHAARHLTPPMSLRDVQIRAGHTNIATTQRYIDPNPEADRGLAMLSMIGRPVMAKAGFRSVEVNARKVAR